MKKEQLEERTKISALRIIKSKIRNSHFEIESKEVKKMLIRVCMECKYHQIRDDEEEIRSFCQKEYCWSMYSKCVEQKALARFFEQEFVSPQLINIMQ